MLPWALFQPTRHAIQPAMIHPVIYGTKREFSETLCPLARYRNQHGYRDPNQHGHHDPFIIAIVVTIIIVTVAVVITCSSMVGGSSPLHIITPHDHNPAIAIPPLPRSSKRTPSRPPKRTPQHRPATPHPSHRRTSSSRTPRQRSQPPQPSCRSTSAGTPRQRFHPHPLPLGRRPPTLPPPSSNPPPQFPPIRLPILNTPHQLHIHRRRCRPRTRRPRRRPRRAHAPRHLLAGRRRPPQRLDGAQLEAEVAEGGVGGAQVRGEGADGGFEGDDVGGGGGEVGEEGGLDFLRGVLVCGEWGREGVRTSVSSLRVRRDCRTVESLVLRLVISAVRRGVMSDFLGVGVGVGRGSSSCLK